MNYKQWSKQYFEQYQKLSTYTKHLRKILKNAKLEQAKELKHRLSLLYPMCLELKHTGEYLKNCERRNSNGQEQSIPH